MDKYKELLELLSKYDLDYQVVNGGPEHAAQLIGTIVRNSTTHIRAFAPEMNGDISEAKGSTLVEDFRSAIERGLTVEVMLGSKPTHESALLKVLRDGVKAAPSRVSVKLAPEEFKSEMIENGQLVHFTVGDDKRFRKEFDPINHMAIGNMNDKFQAEVLTNVFNKHFANATPVFG